MKDFDKLFDDLFAGDFEEIEAELDALDAAESTEGEAPVGEPVAEDEAAPASEGDVVTPAEATPAEMSDTTALSFYDEDEEDDDPDELIEDTEVGGSFESSCPYCGEAVSIFLDPAGGSLQDYVEDCSVCCQAMTVRVRFSAEGQADVTINTSY
jgi:cysteine-rich CPXCG protein